MIKRGHKWLYLFVLVTIGSLSLWSAIPSTDLRVQQIAVPAHTVNTANSTPNSYPLKLLPTDDYKQLINLTNFEFEILNTPCDGSEPLLLVLIHSSPVNFGKRKTIRETWGQNRDNMKLVFLLGRVNDEKVMKKLEDENQKHKDFAQGNFLDAYRNMTYKHVMVFKYAIYHCPQAKYILKTDDDMFVNMPTLMDTLVQDLSPYGAHNLLLCLPAPNLRVIRTWRSKWRVGFDEFADRCYPNYCFGWVLLYSPDVLFAIYREAQKTKYFWIDDVHITGTLRSKLDINYTSCQSLIMTKDTLNQIRTHEPLEYKTFLYSGPDLDEQQIRYLWRYVSKHTKKS